MPCKTLVRSAILLCLPGALGIAVRYSRADSVWIQSGTGNPIAIEGVKVIGAQDDVLVFTTSSGKQTNKAMAQVPQIALDDEQAFSAAEEAFRARQFPAAADNYQKALESTSKPWVKERSALRLVQAANAANNFPVAVHGFIQLVQFKPAAATDNKPVAPANGNVIDQAITELKQALQNARLAADQKTVLNNYLVELYTVKGDSASAAATVGQMAKSGPAAGPDPARQKVAADARLTEARQAYAQRQFAKAADVLDKNGAVFTDPRQRADALYLMAQATAAPGSTDPAQLKDFALAYLRVVAVCSTMPGKPHVADSLLAAGAIEEKLKNYKESLSIYNQIVTEFPGTPAATRAKENVDRLAASAPKS